MMPDEKDYIGPDPLVWVQRLLDVNDSSQFTKRQKYIVRCYLIDLKRELESDAN